MSWISSAANAVGSVVNGIQQRNAAQNASSALQKGAQAAQALELKNQQGAQDFQNNVWTGTQKAEQPYQQLGGQSANSLNNLLQQGFQAPTLEQAEATPGYQFQLQQGTRAINQDAAARGTLLSGNTGVALENYGQGLAQNAYQQTYQNALNQYQANVGALQGGVGAGLTSSGQLGSFGQEAAGNIANVDLTGGAQQAQQINNAAAAKAGGQLGSAAAWGGMIQGLQNSASMFGKH